MKIVVDRRSFARYRAKVDKDIVGALAVAASATTSAARVIDNPLGYDLDEIKSQIHPTAPRPSRRGWSCEVRGEHPLTWIFERGSYARLGRKRSTRGRQRLTEGNRGVKPTRFMRKAAKYGKGVLFRELVRRL